VVEALTNICTQVETMESSSCGTSASGKCGHAALPLAPEKTAKREDVLAMAVISYRDNFDPMSSPSWLLVRRPDTGLLAGQWEFPNTCCWSSNEVTGLDGDKKKKGKRKDVSHQVPLIPAAKRRNAIKTMLQELLVSQNNDIVLPQKFVLSLRLKQLETPIEHIFSHVRHTMWVEHKTIPVTELFGDFETDRDATPIRSWLDSKGREVRWMDEEEMKSVGVTSGVKKVLNVVKVETMEKGLTTKPKTSVNTAIKKHRKS
jgi:A/G-specific adenine glycosylase